MKPSLDYIAGFFDGEGCLSYSRTREPDRYFLRIVIGQKHRRVLDSMKDRMKVGKIRFTKQGHYRWTISGRSEVISFLKAIRGRVVVKHSQVELALIAIRDELTGTRLRPLYLEMQRLKRIP